MFSTSSVSGALSVGGVVVDAIRSDDLVEEGCAQRHTIPISVRETAGLQMSIKSLDL